MLAWRDISSVPSGTDWLKSLVDALRQSRAILLRMTENPFKKDWGRRELEFADPEKPPLPIMPVILHEFEPLPWFSFQFGHFQRQQFSLTELDQSAAALATAIRKMIANAPSAGSDAMTSAPLE